MTRVRIGLLGLSGAGAELGAVLSEQPELHLAAVADRDRSRAAALAERTGGRCYDDYRLMLAEARANGLDAVFVALPTADAEGYLPVAARNTPVVVTVPPFARSAAVALRIAAEFDEQGSTCVVAGRWGGEWLRYPLADVEDACGRVFSACGEAVQSVGQGQEWQLDASLAGGGVMLHGAYEITYLVVATLGMPDSAFAVAGWAAGPDQARSYDTEDAVAAVFRYGDGRLAAISARRGNTDAAWQLTLNGVQRSLIISSNGYKSLDKQGSLQDEVQLEDPRPYAATVDAIALVLTRGEDGFPSRIADHLGTAATLDAVYRSLKTGQAQAPHEFLNFSPVRR